MGCCFFNWWSLLLELSEQLRELGTKSNVILKTFPFLPPTFPNKVFQYHLNNHIQLAVLVVSLAEEKVQKSKKKWGKGSKKYQENLLPLIHSGVLPWWPTYIHIFSSSANAKLGTTLLNQFQEKNWICEFKVDQLGLGWQFIASWSWCWIAIPGRQIYEGSYDTGLVLVKNRKMARICKIWLVICTNTIFDLGNI